MFMLEQTRPFFRFLSLVTLLTFFPSSVAVWNFIPPIQFEAVAQEAGTPAQGPVESATATANALKILTEEELTALTGGPGASTPAESPGEPIRLADLRVGIKEPALLTHLLLAQANDSPAPEAGETLGSRLATTETLMRAGDLPNAFKAAVQLVNAYPGARRDAINATRGLTKNASDAQLNAIEAQLPELRANTTSAYARDYLNNFYYDRADRCAARGDTAGQRAYLELYAAETWQLATEFPNSTVGFWAVGDYVRAMEKIGRKDAAEAVVQGFASHTAQSAARASWWIFQAENASRAGDYWTTKHFYGMLLRDVEHGAFDEMFNDPAVEAQSLAAREYSLAVANMYVDQDVAYDWFLSIVDRYPVEQAYVTEEAYGPVMARWAVAELTARRNPDDPYEGIKALYAFVQEVPESPHVPKVLTRIGGLYTVAGDYAEAIKYYQEVVENHAGTEWAPIAEGEIAFLVENMLDTVEVANNQPVNPQQAVEVAQLCGPKALAHFLALKDIPATVDELAEAAGTDETGTTMLGLVKAAGNKGVQLAGVQASGLDDLRPPFIAFVNHNHFMVVSEVRDEAVVVLDLDKPQKALTRPEFAQMWDGEALVEADPAVLAGALEDAALKGIVGGCDPVLPDPYDTYNNPGHETTEPCPVGDACPPVPLPGQCTTCPGKKGPSDSPGPGSFPQSPPLKPTAAGDSGSPYAWAGLSVEGVNPYIDMFSMGLRIQEKDTSVPINGPFALGFTRAYSSENGDHDGDGLGWNLNSPISAPQAYVYVKITTTPYTIYDPGPPPSSSTYYFHETELELDICYMNGRFRTHHWAKGEYGDEEHPYTDEEISVIMEDMCGESPYAWIDGNNVRWVLDEAQSEIVGDEGGETLNCDYVEDLAARIRLYYNVSANSTTLTAPYGDGRTMTIDRDEDDLITDITIADGGNSRSVEYTYNGNGELSTVTSDGGVTNVSYEYMTYSPGGRTITKITDKAGNEVFFDWYYNASGNCTKVAVSLPNGLVTTYERSLVTGVCVAKNWDGATQLTRHDNWPISTSVHVSNRKDYYYNTTAYARWDFLFKDAAAGTMLTKITGSGNVTVAEYQFDAQNRFTKQRIGNGPWTTYGYTAASTYYPTSVTGPDGLTTTYYLDATDGLVTKITHPSVAEVGYRFAYDDYGNVTSVTSPGGAVTAYEYDAKGNVITMTDPNSSETTMAYDSWGNVVSVTDPNGHATTFEYVAGGCGACGGGGARLTKVTDADSNDTTFAYDVNGNMIEVTDALSRDTEYDYDEMGQMTQVTVDPSGAADTMSFTYDLLGRKITTSDFNGKTVAYTYNQLGDLLTQTDAIGTVSYAPTVFHQISTITDGLNHTWDNDYDAAFRLTKVTDPVSKVTKYFYDSSGRMTKVGAGSSGTVDPTQYFFSGTTGLMTKVGYTAGANTSYANYYFDGDARLTKLTDWIDGTDGLRYAYDAGGRLTTLTDYDDSTLEYTYDAAGNVLTMEDYHGSLVTYTYTYTNRVSTITAPGSKVWDYDYNALGQPTSVAIPNGMLTEYGYDSRNRLTAIEHIDGPDVLDGFYYAMDDGGNITRTTYQDDQYWDYWYDGRDRLTKAERRDDSDALLHRFTYTYDAGDNMTTKAVYDGTDTDTYVYAHTVANELTKQTFSGTDTTFGYDAWGRMTSKSDGTYSASYYYNYGSKLTKVASNFPSEGTVEYEYGADQKRRERDDGTTVTWYNYSAGWTVISQEDNTGNLERTYVGRNVAQVDGPNPSTGSWAFHLCDYLGSIIDLRDNARGQLATYEYSPYGETYAFGGSTDATSHLFTGQDWDALVKFYWTPFRYYSPSRAQWITRDPLGMLEGPNTYAYVRRNPATYADYYGLFGGQILIDRKCKKLDGYGYAPEDSRVRPRETTPLPIPERSTWCNGSNMSVGADALYGPGGCVKIPDGSSCKITCDNSGVPTSVVCRGQVKSCHVIIDPNQRRNDPENVWFPPNPETPDDPWRMPAKTGKVDKWGFPYYDL